MEDEVRLKVAPSSAVEALETSGGFLAFQARVSKTQETL